MGCPVERTLLRPQSQRTVMRQPSRYACDNLCACVEHKGLSFPCIGQGNVAFACLMVHGETPQKYASRLCVSFHFHGTTLLSKTFYTVIRPEHACKNAIKWQSVA